MAKKRQPKSAVKVEVRDGQQSAPGGTSAFFLRNVSYWSPPAWQQAEAWRAFVERQPFASICRDAIANYLNSLDWSISARDSTKRDELKGQIKHYTKLFERGNAYYYDLDFSGQVEWFVKDLFTLPFGTASELGRLDNSPNGKVVWIKPIDGGTLAPTLNHDYPVVQSAPNTGINPIYLGREFVSRVYLSPRTEIRREGWGYAPPERIARAIEMMSTGDTYYAQLLLNTPEAGILDLVDMDKTSATDWAKEAQKLFYGVDPMKIPVLYEHEKPAQWISFGRPPSEIMYDSITLRYAAILCAGYGLTLSDIGFPSASNGGDTLAGTIRMERVGKSSGKAIAKKKHEVYRNQILPDTLKFRFIDYDDEKNVSKGRARLATAQASNIWITNRSFLPSEMRQQAMAEGLIDIDIPEDIDQNDVEFESLVQPGFGGSLSKNTANSKNPSEGGQGQTIPQQIVQKNLVEAEVGISKSAFNVNSVMQTLLDQVRSNLEDGEMEVWEEYVDGFLTGKSDIEEEDLRGAFDAIIQTSSSMLRHQQWTKNVASGLSESVLKSAKEEMEEKLLSVARSQAEMDFIEGKTDDIVEPEITPVLLESHAVNLYGVIYDSLIESVSKHIILMSKFGILEGNLQVDPTELKDNNIKMSREIGKEVVSNFPTILSAVMEQGAEYLQTIIGEDNGK